MTVTDEDREAAQEFWDPSDPRTPHVDDLRSGRLDGHELVQAFARHARQAAERERAEIVGWLRGKFALDVAYVIHGSHAEIAADSIEALAHKERKE